MSFTDIFGGGSILPSWPAYTSLILANDIQLGWPTEVNSGNGEVVAEIIEVTASAPGLTLQLSSALEIGAGYSFLVNNVGANTFTVLDADGNTLASIASGTVWQLYCFDNTTVQGGWRIFQYGAGVSNANASALAGAGLIAIGSTLNEAIIINSQTVNYTAQNSDRAKLIEWTGTGTGTITLPSAAAVGSNWFCYIKNSGGGAITLQPPSGTLDSAASLPFSPNNSAVIVCDGTNYWTIGYGQSLSSTFTYTTINLAGVSGNYTLSGANLGKTSYKLTGAITGNVNFIVPASVAQYWINNQTSGAFTLTIESSGVGGATYTLAQGNSMIVYCDGLNIVPAVQLSSGTPTFPNGSAGAPSITFASDGTTGVYLAGTHTLGFAANGVEVASVSGTGDWIFGAPASGITVTINGLGGNTSLELLSGNSPTNAFPDLLVDRAGSTINQVLQGPNIELADTANHNGVVIQNSGGQIEIWEQFNNGSWFQVVTFDTAGNAKIFKNLTVAGTVSITGSCTAVGGFNT